jgi:hypothetical protein
MALVLRGYYAVLNLQCEVPEDPSALFARAGQRLAARLACLFDHARDPVAAARQVAAAFATRAPPART